MKKENIIKITSINLALLTAISISGFVVSKNRRNQNNSSSITTEFNSGSNFINGNDEVTVEINGNLYTTTNNVNKIDNIKNLEQQFYELLDEKGFDDEVRQALIYVYDTIDQNYDNYIHANSFLNMPSKSEFIQSNVINCLENNVELIKFGSSDDYEVSNKFGNANACYYHGSGEVYVHTNKYSTVESNGRLLCHEIIGHANQNMAVGMFDEIEDIIIEGGATWTLEMLDSQYSYQNAYDLYTMDEHSLDSFGPDIAHKNNLYYKLYGSLMIMTDYQTMMDAYHTKNIEGILSKINENTGYDGEYVLQLMSDVLSTMNDFESNCITAEKLTIIDNLVLDYLVNKSKSAITSTESEQALKTFLKFEQQYMSRNFEYTDDGEKIDVTEQLNKKYVDSKDIIVNESLKNNAIDGFNEKDYYDLLVLCNNDNNKEIGVNKTETKGKIM